MSCGAQTYGAALTALNPGTAATAAIAELDGSATKKIRLLRIAISGTKLTAVAVQDVRLTKLSAVSTGGASTVPTPIPFSTTNHTATAVFKGFTTTPTGGGTVLGAIAVAKLSTDVITTLMPIELVVFDFSTLPLASRPTLLDATQALALDFNGATPAHVESLDIYAWWTEQPLNS